MRFFLFKLFVKAACFFSVKEGWAEKHIDGEKQLKICRKRQAEMDACVRPRSYPKVEGKCSYTDYYESGRNWNRHKR